MRYFLFIPLVFICAALCHGQGAPKKKKKLKLKARKKVELVLPAPVVVTVTSSSSTATAPPADYLEYSGSAKSTDEHTIMDYDRAKNIQPQQGVDQKAAAGQIKLPQIITLRATINTNESNAPSAAGVERTAKFVADHPLEDLPPNSRVVNGPSQYDSRVDVRSLDPALPWTRGMRSNAYSVGVVVDKSKLHKISALFYQIDDSSTLGTTYQLCPGEAFRDQPVVGTGTAMVTGKRQMITAGHVFAAAPKQYAIIFGFEIINKTGAYQKIIPADSIYFPVSIDKQSADLDIALFSVDRDLKAPPLKWSGEANPPVSENIYMIGYPYGLPKKVSANASVESNNETLAIYTSLDAFAGNSGSPVFNLKTNEVIGILVSGGVDFQWNGTCNVSTLCSIPYCKGEKAIRITVIKNLLNYGN